MRENICALFFLVSALLYSPNHAHFEPLTHFMCTAYLLPFTVVVM